MKSDIKTLKDFCIWFRSNKDYDNDHNHILNRFKLKNIPFESVKFHIKTYVDYYNKYAFQKTNNLNKKILEDDIEEITKQFIKE
jgi:hypothetical protein